jgi:hypothetical protein
MSDLPPKDSGSVVVTPGTAPLRLVTYPPDVIVSTAAATADNAARLAADPRVADELRPMLERLAADSKRTAAGVAQLVEAAKNPTDRRLAIVSIVVAIVSFIGGVVVTIALR